MEQQRHLHRQEGRRGKKRAKSGDLVLRILSAIYVFLGMLVDDAPRPPIPGDQVDIHKLAIFLWAS